ncbi:hypothetical protein F2Q69_00012374 [Brassica cretica]|uniref:Uncharacterized protein n=1 Tax=Brassica cretica TaxID=69181 RepID=A0A8S9QKR6_BRACR|nr:hypothetical protein F2Q69_00012374 [Brassica cretica]
MQPPTAGQQFLASKHTPIISIPVPNIAQSYQREHGYDTGVAYDVFDHVMFMVLRKTWERIRIRDFWWMALGLIRGWVQDSSSKFWCHERETINGVHPKPIKPNECAPLFPELKLSCILRSGAPTEP